MTDNELLIPLVDGGIVDIHTDQDFTSGCPTCNYGSEYTNYIELMMTKNIYNIVVSQMYHYAIEVDFLIKLFFKNIDKIREMTEEECAHFVYNAVNGDEFSHPQVTMTKTVVRSKR